MAVIAPTIIPKTRSNSWLDYLIAGTQIYNMLTKNRSDRVQDKYMQQQMDIQNRAMEKENQQAYTADYYNQDMMKQYAQLAQEKNISPDQAGFNAAIKNLEQNYSPSLYYAMTPEQKKEALSSALTKQGWATGEGVWSKGANEAMGKNYTAEKAQYTPEMKQNIPTQKTAVDYKVGEPVERTVPVMGTMQRQTIPEATMTQPTVRLKSQTEAIDMSGKPVHPTVVKGAVATLQNLNTIEQQRPLNIIEAKAKINATKMVAPNIPFADIDMEMEDIRNKTAMIMQKKLADGSLTNEDVMINKYVQSPEGFNNMKSQAIAKATSNLYVPDPELLKLSLDLRMAQATNDVKGIQNTSNILLNRLKELRGVKVNPANASDVIFSQAFITSTLSGMTPELTQRGYLAERELQSRQVENAKQRQHESNLTSLRFEQQKALMDYEAQINALKPTGNTFKDVQKIEQVNYKDAQALKKSVATSQKDSYDMAIQAWNDNVKRLKTLMEVDKGVDTSIMTDAEAKVYKKQNADQTAQYKKELMFLLKNKPKLQDYIKPLSDQKANALVYKNKNTGEATQIESILSPLFTGATQANLYTLAQKKKIKPFFLVAGILKDKGVVPTKDNVQYALEFINSMGWYR